MIGVCTSIMMLYLTDCVILCFYIDTAIKQNDVNIALEMCVRVCVRACVCACACV
jgi:hypothetical protein